MARKRKIGPLSYQKARTERGAKKPLKKKTVKNNTGREEIERVVIFMGRSCLAIS